MSTQPAKTARPSSKIPARTAKKSAKGAKSVKSARSSGKKPAKSARGAAVSGNRPTRAAALRASSAGSKTSSKAAKTVSKSASKTSSKPVSSVKPGESPAAQAFLRMMRTVSPPVQPAAVIDVPVMAHKYQVGETVYFTSPSFGRAAATGSYTVVKHLPTEGDDHQYRIKSAGEAFERVAKESQLDRV